MEHLLKQYRQDLHRIPELGYEEYETKAYILNILSQYPCEITELCGTGICAFFHSNKNDSKGCAIKDTIAFRSDMDGLPVTEKTRTNYSSIHSGKMHACGHDGHMAMLLALAGKVNEIIHTLPHNVLLIFQPSEETSGGAKDICQTGILTKHRVKMIFGIHLWPMLEKHALGSRACEFMVRSSEIDITIKGKSAHCANAEHSVDALSIGCEFLSEIYNMIDTEIPEKEYRLLKFGKMTSGTVRNSISDYTLLQGTLRCFNQDTFHYILDRINHIASCYQTQYHCTITISYTEGYPPVINDPSLFLKAKEALNDFKFHTFEKPFMQAEDFSFYQQEVPGLFLFLGTGTNIPLHSNDFDFDEDVLNTGLEAYLKLLELE